MQFQLDVQTRYFLFDYLQISGDARKLKLQTKTDHRKKFCF